MTKGGIHAFTRFRSPQPGRQGIRVMQSHRGGLRTPLKSADRPADRVKNFNRHAHEAERPSPRRSRVCIHGRPELREGYITGEILPIIGGYSGG